MRYLHHKKLARNFITTSAILVAASFLIALVLGNIQWWGSSSTNTVTEPAPSVSESYLGDPLDISELIESSDAAIIGEVGEILATEYPLAYQESEYTSEEWSILNENNWLVEGLGVVFHDIGVREVLYGQVPPRFPLLRDDVEYYNENNLTPLKEGEVILIFLSIEPGDPNFAKSYDTFYTTFDNGLFDIEDNRAYPRLPEAFKDNDSAYYHQTDNPSDLSSN